MIHIDISNGTATVETDEKLTEYMIYLFSSGENVVGKSVLCREPFGDIIGTITNYQYLGETRNYRLYLRLMRYV